MIDKENMLLLRLKKLVNHIRWKYFTNLQAGYTYQAVHNEIYQVHKIIEEGDDCK